MIFFLRYRLDMRGGRSIFDGISKEDLIVAFFPCTRFEARIPLEFRGEAFQQKKWDDIQKLEYAMQLHKELHRNYELISQLAALAIKRGFKMVIENPYTAPHYLTMYWCLKPAIIDKDRRSNGDYYKKPTQYWFIGFKPKQNLVFEPLDYVPVKTIERCKAEDGKSREVLRSMIHPQYANRFIRQFLI